MASRTPIAAHTASRLRSLSTKESFFQTNAANDDEECSRGIEVSVIQMFPFHRCCAKRTNLPLPQSIHFAVQIGARMSKKNGLAEPTRLKPFDSDDKRLLQVASAVSISHDGKNGMAKGCPSKPPYYF
jgi:hypothetical protein